MIFRTAFLLPWQDRILHHAMFNSRIFHVPDQDKSQDEKRPQKNDLTEYRLPFNCLPSDWSRGQLDQPFPKGGYLVLTTGQLVTTQLDLEGPTLSIIFRWMQRVSH